MKPIYRYCFLSIISVLLLIAGRLSFEGLSQAKDALYVIPLFVFSVIMLVAYAAKVELKYKWLAILLPLLVVAIIMRLTVGLPVIFLT